jgi:hypothetical protein
MASASHNIVETIVKANYSANAGQLELLAAAIVLGDMADVTHLRVLLHNMQSKLGRPRRGKQPPQEPVLDAVHEEMYPHLLKGVGPDDMDQTERHRKANRFRSNASTVRFFIRNGGDVRGVDVATVTKSGLRRAVQSSGETSTENETRTQRGFRTHAAAVLSAAQRLARGDPEDARERIEGLMDQLEKLLNELGAPAQQQDVGGATTTIVAGRPGVGRGAPAGAMLHRPAGT